MRIIKTAVAACVTAAAIGLSGAAVGRLEGARELAQAIGDAVGQKVRRRAIGLDAQLGQLAQVGQAMLEGLLRHGTEMEVEKNYVDSHGQSSVAFAFCHLLGFHLLPRLKGIHRQKLYRPTTGQPDAYPNLQVILEQPIRWESIRQQYDQMIKYATALRLGTADAETILKRFTRSNFQHPTYRAILELGRAVKTVFLCQYLHEEALRREINNGL